MPTQDDLTRNIAPCGLICYSCPSYCDGPVAQHAEALQRWLTGFGPVAEVFSEHQPSLAEYPAFARVLAMLAESSCHGCRSGECPFAACHVRPCTQERGFDWCFQCPDFPCAEVKFDPQLQAVWLRANRRMAEIGAAGYWEEMKDRPHYERRDD